MKHETIPPDPSIRFSPFDTQLCPWADRYVNWLKTPLGVLVVTATVSLVSGFILGPQGYCVFAATASVIVLGLVWPWLALRGVTCKLEFPQHRVVEGDSVSATLTCPNRWPFPVWGLVVEQGFLGSDENETTELRWLWSVDGRRPNLPVNSSHKYEASTLGIRRS